MHDFAASSPIFAARKNLDIDKICDTKLRIASHDSSMPSVSANYFKF